MPILPDPRHLRPISVAVIAADLGMDKGHSRPHMSDDNSLSEAPFKTLKYRPDSPERSDSPADARIWARRLYAWYNAKHHDSGLALVALALVYGCQVETICLSRQAIPLQAYPKHPERLLKDFATPDELSRRVLDRSDQGGQRRADH